MLRRAQAEHILRAAAGVTNHDRFVVVGTGAVILSAKRPIPAVRELDVWADGVEDAEALSETLDGTIGRGTAFHRFFAYHADGVGPRTAMMPLDWRSRATEHRGAEAGGAIAICPDRETAGERRRVGFAALFRPRSVAELADATSIGGARRLPETKNRSRTLSRRRSPAVSHDIALAKLCAWREKDIAWLREAVAAGVVSPARMRENAGGGMPEGAPPGDEIGRRLSALG